MANYQGRLQYKIIKSKREKIERNNFPTDNERTSKRYVHKTEQDCKLLF